MKNLKRSIALLAVAALSVGALAACGDDEGASGDAEGSVYFLNWKPESEATYGEIAEKYTEETGVEVSVDALVSVSALPDPVVYANGDQAAYWDMSFSCSYVRGEPAPV